MTARLDQVARRAVTNRDSGFLRDRFAERRDDLLVLPRDSRDLMVDMQFRAARARRDLDHPTASHEILVHDDLSVGVLVLDEQPDAVHIVDLAVRLAARGRGIGSSVVAQVCADAEAAGRSVAVRVRIGSPRTRAFFERHGFVRVGSSAGYDELRRA